jgi:long-subunit fatty acid transport protein
MSAFLCLACAGLAALCTRSAAQTVIPISPEPVGSGARALGQSAFIAVADDATAASWNPAGLINLVNPEASFVGVARTVSDRLSTSDPGFSLEGADRSETEINFMSYAHRIPLRNPDVVLSVNYHQAYDLGLKYTLTSPKTGAPILRQHNTAEGAISAYSIAGGLSLPWVPEIALGAGFNWYAHSLLNGAARRFKRTSVDWEVDPPEVYEVTTETLDDLQGYNFTFGLLWDIYEKEGRLLTLGLVGHTPFTATVEQEVADIPGGPRPGYPVRLDIDFPLSLGAGLNYRFSDRFSTALDVEWTDWSHYAYTGATSSPADDAFAVRLGCEHLWFSPPGKGSVYALRGGVFYEPRPAWSEILPVYGLSLGLGWTVKEVFSLDFAYRYRWGEVEDFLLDGTNLDYGIEEHWFIGSIIVYFR